MPILIDSDTEAPVPDAADLRKEVNAKADGSEDEVLERCIIEAVQLVSRHVDDRKIEGVFIPVEIATAAYRMVAVELYHRRNAPHGIVNEQFAGPMGDVTAPIRISRDPLAGVKPMLAPWLMTVVIA